MDNFELYLYIILGVIYLISRLVKAKPAPPASGKRRSAQSDTGETEKPFSFEDLFREFEEQTQPKTEEAPGRESQKPTFVKPGSSEYRRRAEEKEEELSWAAKRDEQAPEYKTYEGTTYENYDLSKELESMGSLLKGKKEKVVEQKKESSYYINLVKKPNGARDAFVMSEIFNRKY